MKRATSGVRKTGTWGIGLLCALVFGQAIAGVSGAIFTTTSDGTSVDKNIYDAKADVYLNGGPQNQNDPGLSPDGLYYFQVTDPSGAILLSTDDISCRVVQVTGGRIVGVPLAVPANCTTGLHALGTTDPSNGQTPVQLIPYNNTPNPGGEYKAWLTPVDNYSPDPNNPNCSSKNSNVVHGFCDSDSKTDNFKVKAGLAQVLVCKFIDATGNGLTDDDVLYSLLPGWTFTATGVDPDPTKSVSAQSQDGCVLFSVSTLPATVTITEENRQFWTQTWPVDNNGQPINPVTVTVNKVGDFVEVDFANFNTEQEGALTVTKDAQPSYTLGWTIQKSVVGDSTKNSGTGSGTFDYSVSVGNDGGSNWTVTGYIHVTSVTNQTGVTITDAVNDGGICSITDTNGGLNETLSANVELKVPYACTYATKPDPFGATGQNTATVTLLDGTVRTGTAIVDFSSATVANSCVDVTDTLGGDLGDVCIGDANPTVIPYSATVTGTAGTCKKIDNTATFTSTTDSTVTGSDSKEVTLCVGKDLTVSKTATPAFTRTYKWTIAKKVDKTLVEQVGGTATFNYEVDASETGFTDSAWTVKGKITVTNPNDWEAITVNVSDAIDNGADSCIVTGGTGVSIPASSSKSFYYTCTYSSAPNPLKGTNTGTATWDSAAAFTPDGKASGTATADFGATTPTKVNPTITVTDTFKGTLGTLTATDSAPFASAAYKYSRTITVVADKCNSYDNTATIVETNQTSKQTVQVCGAAAGGLTMGFWHNNNGQGIITGGAYTLVGTVKVCNSGTWLRQFTPFQDLSSTATCAQVASYFLTAFNAANCGGITCNTMLKSQMLATALNVYFSDAALGGNKISAPAPIGGLKIDLTKICKMIDGSGGTATCPGTYENASSAFGGATSLTVLQMLAFENGVSNVGGTTWYAQVKATQVLAKDAFDAINNDVAFIAP